MGIRPSVFILPSFTSFANTHAHTHTHVCSMTCVPRPGTPARFSHLIGAHEKVFGHPITRPSLIPHISLPCLLHTIVLSSVLHPILFTGNVTPLDPTRKCGETAISSIQSDCVPIAVLNSKLRLRN